MQKIVRLLIVSAFILTGCMSDPTSAGKVTDPADPRFDPMKFSYLDYNGFEERNDAFRKLFPVGTDKRYVDEILVKNAGAKTWLTRSHKHKLDGVSYSYFFEGTTSYREMMGWGPVTENITVVYNKNYQVMQIFNNQKELFSNGKEK